MPIHQVNSIVNQTNKEPSVVLIIDDMRENRLLLSSQLRLDGHSILEASGGHDGIAMAQEHDPDLILLDVMMPDINGFEVCKILKGDTRTHLIPIIMITALSKVESRIEGKKAGADEFLSRPHIREELLVRVRTLIQLKRARTNLEEERHRLQLLYNISRAVSTQLDLESMMSTIITQTQAAVGATKGNIMLLNEQEHVYHKFIIRAGSPIEISDRVTQEVMTRGLGGWLVANKRSEIIHNIRQDDRWVTLPDDEGETGSAIGVPLIGSDRIVGILILNHPDVGYFTEEHRELLIALGSTVSTAIANAHLFTEISEERRKLEAILRQATDAIVTTDENWNISLFNKAAERLFDITADDVAGRYIGDIKPLSVLLKVYSNGNNLPNAQEINLENGNTLFTSVSPIQDVGYAAVLQDITELKRIEEFRLTEERRKKQEIKETFSRYMGPSLVDYVLSHEPGLMARRERRHAVVMFADIRSFTRFTRLVEPNEVIERLNKFFTKMTEVVYRYEGTIFELTGDEILVAFNAPFDQLDAANRAVETAVAMQKRFNALRMDLFEELRTGFGMGIGIDEGNVIVGNVGAETRMTFRMVGDAVNTAHRLVDIAVDGQIVVSEGIYQNLQIENSELLQAHPLKSMGAVEIRGKDEPENLYQIHVSLEETLAEEEL
ncbi:MAG: response regulator [Ardenticatenaceae bacterium]|nr:response regulator [Ardenticatenaceae bacterium]MCB8950280.1 response regulator [Ardenticatenaceae bacterium]